MIKTLYEIGKVLKEKYPEYFEPWKNPFQNQEAKVIVANIKDGRLDGELEIEDFKSELLRKYLYRDPVGKRGTYLLPTLKLYTPNKRSEDDFNKDIDRLKRTLNYQNELKVKFEYVDRFVDQISSKLNKVDFNSDYKYLFTIKFDNKYLGEYDTFKSILDRAAYEEYYKTKKFTSRSKNKLCSITYEQSKEVWGKINTLGFTVDDIAFMRNGFNQSESYKMFPVSPEAVKILEGAKGLVTEKFSGKQYYLSGISFFILPHFINIKTELQKEIIKDYFGKVSYYIDDKNKTLIENEVLLNEIINDKKLSSNQIYYDLFFYQQNQAQLLIKLQINDILPSRLKRIFDVKKAVQEFYKPILKIQFKKGKKEEIVNFFITFSTFKKYYSEVINKKTIFHPSFFKIIEAVIYENGLNEIEVLKAFLKKIVIDFKNRSQNKYAFSQTVKESFALYQFLYNLNLFKPKNLMENKNNVIELNVDGFISQHSSFFDTDYKKGVFMLGVLTSKLLAKQRSKLQSEPFLKNLNNLNIDESEIKKLLPKLINKIREYDISYYTKDLEGEIASSLVLKHELSKTETSYLFTLGIVMGNEFDKEFFRKLKEEENK